MSLIIIDRTDRIEWIDRIDRTYRIEIPSWDKHTKSNISALYEASGASLQQPIGIVPWGFLSAQADGTLYLI